MRVCLTSAALVFAAAAVFVVPPAAAQQAAQQATQSAGTAINPMTGEDESAEALRARLARLQIQARIESELTNIERSRQERKRLSSGEPKAEKAPVPVKPIHRATLRPSQPLGDHPSPAPVQTAVPTSDPRLVGIVKDGDSTLALVDVAGRTVSVVEGRREGGITVGVIDGDTAVVNGQPVQMPASPGRLVAPPAGPSPVPAQAPGISTGSPGPLPSPLGPSLPAILSPLGAREAGWLP